MWLSPGLLAPGNAGSNTAADHMIVLEQIAAFRYRVLHVAARITRGARQRRLRIDATWRWATAIATAWNRIHVVFTT